MSILVSLACSGWGLDLDRDTDNVLLVPPQKDGAPLSPAVRMIILTLQANKLIGPLWARSTDGRRQAVIADGVEA